MVHFLFIPKNECKLQVCKFSRTSGQLTVLAFVGT